MSLAPMLPMTLVPDSLAAEPFWTPNMCRLCITMQVWLGNLHIYIYSYAGEMDHAEIISWYKSAEPVTLFLLVNGQPRYDML